jgi:hypothetical protein
MPVPYQWAALPRFGLIRDRQNGSVEPEEAAEGARTLDLLHGKQTL